MVYFSIVDKGYNIEDEKTEIILPDQFCNVETCSICKNNLYGTKNTNVCPLIDLRKSNVSKAFHKLYVVMCI